MEQKTKLTVRINQRWVDNAKRYARRHNTTVTQIVSDFFRQLGMQDAHSAQTPVLQRMAGILPGDISIEQRREHLVEKYGG